MNELLVVGSHLVTPRTGYLHHGLYAGCGMVIHYAGLSNRLRSGPVEEVSLETFSAGCGIQMLDSSDALFAGVSAIQRARSRLGEDRYNLLTNNCEHFVYWCLHGKHRSAQVNQTLKAAGSLLASRYLGSAGGSLLGVASTPVTATLVSGLALGYGVHRYLQRQSRVSEEQAADKTSPNADEGIS